MNRYEWYEVVNEKISQNLDSFYESMYSRELELVGFNTYRINPCPICEHNDCATLKADDGYVNCFHEGCDFRGNHIGAFIKYVEETFKAPNNNKGLALKLLAKWSGVPYPKTNNPAELAAIKKSARRQQIRETSIDFYHKQLKSCNLMFNVNDDANERLISLTPLDYQRQIRQHSLNSLEIFKVGFVCNSNELKKGLIEDGFTEEEIYDALTSIPEGVFIYPYMEPRSGDILRFNVKNPFEQTREIQGKEVDIKGFSVGAKVCGFAPDFNFNKDIIIVEGENDALSTYEAGFHNVVWLGGTIDEKRNLLRVLENVKGKIYVATDNDSVGEEYYKIIDEYFPHKDVRRISIPKIYKDIDEYYKNDEDPVSIKQLMEETTFVKTEFYKCQKDKDSVRFWKILNRHKCIEFMIDKVDSSGQIVGRVDYFTLSEDGTKELKERQIGVSLIKCKQVMKPFVFYLSDEIEDYFNTHFEDRSFEELLDIYTLSRYQASIERELANRLYKVEGDEKDKLVSRIKKKLNQDICDVICQEMVNITNVNIVNSELVTIPSMKISQYFNIINNDAYFYFSQDKVDGDAIRRLPYLLRNDGQTIRLDLLKRKDDQCLLLIDNKYEISQEVPSAIMDLKETSLMSNWAMKYKNGEIEDSEINPYTLIKEIENYIRRFYYFKDNSVYKVISLYIYATYFYELFAQMPYLFLNGEKGSGKSTLDKALYLLCFNAKLSVDISEASLFRVCSFEGGTLILDEIEKFTSRAKTTDSTMASVLKAGYSKSGKVYRYNSDKNASEGFDIYTPKIISNIFGLDDVIGDRCIEIRTYRYDMDSDIDLDLEDPKFYESEKLGEIRELTSKCCISALKHFQLMHKVYTDRGTKMHTTSPRTAQVLKPLLAVAKFVDLFGMGIDTSRPVDLSNLNGEYETALSTYHDNYVVESKENMNLTSPEDILKKVVKRVAEELGDSEFPHEDKVYTICENYRYQEPIKFNLEEGWFKIDIVHFKCFLEQELPGEQVYTRNISKWLNNIFNIGKMGDVKMTRVVAHLTDNDLIKEWRGAIKPKVNAYTFKFTNYLRDKSITFDNEGDGKLF